MASKSEIETMMGGVFDRSKLALLDVGLKVSAPIRISRSFEIDSISPPISPFKRVASCRQDITKELNCVLVKEFENMNMFQLKDSMRKALKVRDHFQGFKLYTKSFPGQQAVAWMLLNGVVNSVDDAILLGGMLLRDGLIYDVVNDEKNTEKVFKAGYHLYRFSEDDNDQFDAQFWGNILQSNVILRERRQGLKSYSETFLGMEAVQACLRSCQVKSRAEAKSICQNLLKAGVIQEAEPKSRNASHFIDGIDLYRFVKTTSGSPISSASSSTSGISSMRISPTNFPPSKPSSSREIAPFRKT
mmetsp:Transcript_9299/g.16753  ORF Transcript_9299/g.16753 Transcript_9299/m.16753 type:complete len:302 (-) Transcript_9299:100-1005(-)